jgi:hypothetical protein
VVPDVSLNVRSDARRGSTLETEGDVLFERQARASSRALGEGGAQVCCVWTLPAQRIGSKRSSAWCSSMHTIKLLNVKAGLSSRGIGRLRISNQDSTRRALPIFLSTFLH